MAKSKSEKGETKKHEKGESKAFEKKEQKAGKDLPQRKRIGVLKTQDVLITPQKKLQIAMKKLAQK
jgi:hypothetical protein